MISFTIPFKVTGKWSLNSIYSGKHWAKRGNQAAEIHLLVQVALRKQKIPKQPFTAPVNICIYYNSRLDIDNHGYLSKLIIDGLKGWVVVDDNRKYVHSLTQEFWSGNGILVEVSERDTGKLRG